MTENRFTDAKNQLEAAFKKAEEAHRKWAECVTNLHMSEVALWNAQRSVRESYDFLVSAMKPG